MADNVNTQRFDIVNGKQLALLVAPTVCLFLAAVAVAARWYTKSVRRINTLTEDALCLAALVMSLLVVAMVYTLVFLCGEGLGKYEIQKDPTKDFNVVHRTWLRVQFALDICWATSVATVQLAFVKFYVRLYERKSLARTGCYVSMALIGIWYLWTLAGWISMCHPPGACGMQSRRSCIIIGSLHVFFNGLILFAPLPAIFTARLSPRKKASTFFLFLLGCFCTVLAALRIECAINVFGDFDADPIGASWWRVCFAPIEIAVGIICCCVPNVQSLPSWHRQHARSFDGVGLRRIKNRTTSISSSTSNLTHPAQWMPGPKPQVNTVVTLDRGTRSLERAGSLGCNEIKVTKQYGLNRI